jgi:hypothetical protein
MGESRGMGEMLDRFEVLAKAMDFHSRRAWEAYFETLIREAGSPDEARLVKGIFRYVERQHCLSEQNESTL